VRPAATRAAEAATNEQIMPTRCPAGTSGSPAGGTRPEAVHMGSRTGSTVLRGLLDRIDASTLDARAQDVLDQLRAWDGRMAADSAGAAGLPHPRTLRGRTGTRRAYPRSTLDETIHCGR
jgi:hypothetical protein